MGVLVDHHRHFRTAESALDFHVREFWPAHEERFDPRKPRKADAHAVAVVNAGRWIVRCPHCPGAQMADPDDRRFFCIDCLMVETDGRWAVVDWPAETITPAIEEALLLRRMPANRNWEPHEDVSFLIAENVMNGTGHPITQRLERQLDETGSVGL